MASAFRGMYGWTSKFAAEENKMLSDEDLKLVEEISKLQVTSSPADPAIKTLQTRLLTSTNQIAHLTRENADLKYQVQRLKDERKQAVEVGVNKVLEKEWFPVFRQLDQDNKQLNTRNIALNRHIFNGENELIHLRAEQAEMKRSTHIAEQAVRKYEQQVNKLTETISRNGPKEEARQGTTRDDDYFATEFSELVNGVQQWVFRHFRGGAEDRLAGLEGDLKIAFEECVHEAEPVKKSRAQLDAISAMVVWMLNRDVFQTFRYLAFGDLQEPFAILYDTIEGTELQRHLWRSKTVDMLCKHPDVLAAFATAVEAHTNELSALFTPLCAKTSKVELRTKSLHALVDKTAKLALEVAQQQAVFDLWPVAPGEEYDTYLMEDAAADAEEKEDEEDSEAEVRVQLFPAVLRMDFDRDGVRRDDNIAVVLKAKVVSKPVVKIE
ncbi:hypothetical protein DFP73DRAFT_536075 [Morchella snyderi]|nr:hypothetical protein DFP73DRAFT_536075 [Morchella snyderi]